MGNADPKTMATLDQRLRDAMVRRKLSHKQAANLAGVSDKTIQRILAGASPTPKVLGRILEIIGDDGAAAVAQAPSAALAPELHASIAVLPFDVFGDEAGLGFIADGLVEELLTSLAQFSELTVIARNSSFSFRGSGKDLATIAAALNVRYIVEGSVRGTRDALRVVVQLIDSETGAHVWAGRYDRAGTNILQLQDDVSAEIVSRIVPSLWRSEIGRLRRSQPQVLDAWGLAIRAWTEYIAELTPAAAERGIAEAERAVALDPAYGFARVVLACLFAEVGSIPMTARAAEARVEAERHAGEALRLAEHDPLVLLGCAYVRIRLGRADEAMVLLDRAVAICPNHAYIRTYRGLAFALTGRLEEGVAELTLAERLSPVDTVLYRLLAFRAAALLALGRDKDAEHDFERSLALKGDYPVTLSLFAGLKAAAGRIDDAVTMARAAQASMKVPFPFIVAALRAGVKDEALLSRMAQGWALLEGRV